MLDFIKKKIVELPSEKLIMSIINSHITPISFISGGRALHRYMEGKTVFGDIDIYIECTDDWDKYIEKLQNNFKERFKKFDTINPYTDIETWLLGEIQSDNQKYQVIGYKNLENNIMPADILSNFDLSVCQVGYYFNKQSNVFTEFSTKMFEYSIKNKVILPTKDINEPSKSYWRALKYEKRLENFKLFQSVNDTKTLMLKYALENRLK